MPHLKKNTFFGHESRRHFVLTSSKLDIFTIRDRYYIWQNVTFLDKFYVSLGMTNTSSKRQQVVLEYV